MESLHCASSPDHLAVLITRKFDVGVSARHIIIGSSLTHRDAPIPFVLLLVSLDPLRSGGGMSRTRLNVDTLEPLKSLLEGVRSMMEVIKAPLTCLSLSASSSSIQRRRPDNVKKNETQNRAVDDNVNDISIYSNSSKSRRKNTNKDSHNINNDSSHNKSCQKDNNRRNSNSANNIEKHQHHQQHPQHHQHQQQQHPRRQQH